MLKICGIFSICNWKETEGFSQLNNLRSLVSLDRYINTCGKYK